MKIKQKSKSRIKLRGNDLAFVIVIYVLLAIFFIITIYPLIYVISASISDPTAVASGKMLLLPVGINFKGYLTVLQYEDIWIGYVNVFFYAILGTLVAIVITIPCAYALSKKELIGRSIAMKIFLITMYVNGGLVPTYINIQNLHLLDTRTIMILLGAFSVYNMIVARTYFIHSIPGELYEASYLDGCGDWKAFLEIVLPLSKPIIVVMALYYGVTHWNSYFNAMIYLSDRTKFPLQLILREILTKSDYASTIKEGMLSEAEIKAMLQQQDMANRMKYATIVITTIPMMIIYPFCQRYFEKGIMIGSVKG